VNKTVIVKVRVDPETANQFKKLTKELNSDQSKVLRSLIHKAVINQVDDYQLNNRYVSMLTES
jgi:antitoxin component of RelBE/YafQ-DinJ toxin-antitoxin module